jgi:hypothetical protein
MFIPCKSHQKVNFDRSTHLLENILAKISKSVTEISDPEKMASIGGHI